MKILFHLPAPHTIYAGRTIAQGYKNAFVDLGHSFRFLTPADDQEKVFSEFQPNIFFTGVGPLTFKFLNLEALKRAKKNGTKVFVSLPFWKSPLSSSRINEVGSLSANKSWVKLISSGDFGDAYYNVCEQGDERMDGFSQTTGFQLYTVLLAADKTLLFPDPDQKYQANISYIGTFLPEKRQYFRDYVFPLKKKYDLKLYGQDWTFADRSLGFAQKIGQFLNLPFLNSLQKPKLALDEERKIYSSSDILINIHEHYQKKFGDLNERTFKIPCAGGFQICDFVPTLTKYFVEDKEIVISKNDHDLAEKIHYFIQRPAERNKIAAAGRKRVLAEHTYHHRVKQILEIFATLS